MLTKMTRVFTNRQMTENAPSQDLRSYQSLLKDYYLKQKNKNSLRSIRMFAKQLGLSPSYISLIFSEKRHLNLKTAEDISTKLFLPAHERKYFLSLVEYQTAKNETTKEKALSQLQKLAKKTMTPSHLEMDIFIKMSHWYYNSILAFLSLPNERMTTKNIARRFGLDVFLAENCLQRLERLKLVEYVSGKWRSKNEYLEVKSMPSAILRSYQKSILQMALAAIDGQSFDERESSSLVFTIDPNQLPLARQLISEFQDQLASTLDSSKATEVYQCSIQLFRNTLAKEPCNEKTQ